MKNICLSLLIFSFFACAASEKFNEIEKDSETDSIEETFVDPMIPVGDVSDISLYPSKPYLQDGAGYQGKEFNAAQESTWIIYQKVGGTTDSAVLESIIDQVSASGGGHIRIPSGEYFFKNIELKSNVFITFESGVIIHMDVNLGGKGFLFNVGVTPNQPMVENVQLIGLGTPENRPKLYLERQGNAFRRAVAFGYAKNVIVENFSIYDEYTKGTAIAFNPVQIDEENAHIPENVTIANISMTGASIGYGLAQTNTGRNILLKNLVCEGGMTCRIEAHTGRHLDIGVYNIIIKNVVSKNGKAAVLLQPHSVINGRVMVDVANSIGSSWTLFLKEGFVAKDSKRRAKGSFDASSTFKNISMTSTDDTASMSFKNFKYVPESMKYLYHPPNFVRNEADVNHTLGADGKFSNESPIQGPSVAVIFIDASYPLKIPKTQEIALNGVILDRKKIYRIEKI